MSVLIRAVPFPTRPTRSMGMETGYPLVATACGCPRPLSESDDPGHCLWCGHDTADVIAGTFRDQALRTRTAGRRISLFGT